MIIGESSFSLHTRLLLLGDEGGLGLFLVDPQVGVLHKIFLFLAVVVLRHRPEIKILVLSGILRTARFLLAVAGLLVPVILPMPVGPSSGSYHPFVLGSHHICPELLILLDQLFFLLSMLVDLLTLLPDDGGHLFYFLLELTVLAVDSNDDLFVGCDRGSGTLGDVAEEVLFGDDL